MAQVEARPFLDRVSGPEAAASEASPLSINGRSRQKVLVIGDKRPRIYRRYARTARSGGGVRAHLSVPPSAADTNTRHGVCAAWHGPEPHLGPTTPSTDVARTVEMCRATSANDATEAKPAQTEWKLVYLLG